MYLTSLHNTNELLDLGIWTAHEDGTYSIDLNIPAVYYTGDRMASYTLSKDEADTWLAKREIYADHLKSRKIDYDCVTFSMGDHEIEKILDFVARDFGNVFDLYQHKINEVYIHIKEDDIDTTDMITFSSKEDDMIEDTFIDELVRYLKPHEQFSDVAHVVIAYDDDALIEKEIIIDSRDEDVETE